jgi:hypothetical protein
MTLTTVSQWTKKHFRHMLKTLNNALQGETDGNATSMQKKGKPGRPRKDANNEDSKTSHFYLEDADGVPVSEEQITEMSCKAHMLWRTLHEDGMAPETFSQISMKAMGVLLLLHALGQSVRVLTPLQ